MPVAIMLSWERCHLGGMVADESFQIYVLGRSQSASETLAIPGIRPPIPHMIVFRLALRASRYKI
jgi:hypothetical protein